MNQLLPTQAKKKMGQWFVLVILSVLIVQRVFPRDLPQPPSRFSWQEIPELKAAFLKPDGWFFKREKQQETLAYFITKEDIGKNGRFKTGLTVNVFHLKKDSAVERAQGLIENIAKPRHGEMWTEQAGVLQKFGCLVKDTDATGPIVMQALGVANSKTNTLYFFIFESPESEWNAAGKIGKQILDMLVIDEGS